MATGFLSELIQEKIVICPACHHDHLVLSNDQLLCLGCQKPWPVRNAVPDLYSRYKLAHDQACSHENFQKTENNQKNHDELSQKTNDELTDLLINALELQGEKSREAVQSIVTRTSVLSSMDDALTAEIQDVKDRFLPSDTSIPDIPADANKAPGIFLERHYFPAQITAGTSLTANIRVKNIGYHPWSSRTRMPLLLAVIWTAEKKNGFIRQSDPVRVPVDIAPERSITVPITVSAPGHSGRYALTPCLVDGENQVAARAAEPFVITVKPHSLKDRITTFFTPGKKITPVVNPGIAAYDKDHETGRAIFEAELKKRRRLTRVLEIGAGVHPQTAWIKDSQTLALDISAPLLELGSLYFTQKNLASKVGFICADGCSPPFKSGSFDAVALFSTLHHFPEPETVLKNTAGLLKKDGFMAVMCEPVNDTLEGAETIRELQKGINEQVFTWPEYVRIFALAGLDVVSLQIDGGSLKAILTCR
ncbi:MAG: class I SAM-dependent methyltransferase [Desulfotignum sp.]|nr:class I SAM-dependent methyltransferase [Desulfotignum sp.]